jgi:hypothetical protein
MATPPDDRRISGQARYRAQWLRERRMERALDVESSEFWRFGEWIAELEASAASQRSAGNMLKGDGQGGSASCGQITGCQANVINVCAIIRRLREMVGKDGDAEYTIATVDGFKLDLERLIREN